MYIYHIPLPISLLHICEFVCTTAIPCLDVSILQLSPSAISSYILFTPLPFQQCVLRLELEEIANDNSSIAEHSVILVWALTSLCINC